MPVYEQIIHLRGLHPAAQLVALDGAEARPSGDGVSLHGRHCVEILGTRTEPVTFGDAGGVVDAAHAGFAEE